MKFYGSYAKRWWDSKTIWFANAQVTIGSVLLLLEVQFDLVSPYLGKWSGAVLMALGVVNLLLRLRTSTPIAGSPVNPDSGA